MGVTDVSLLDDAIETLANQDKPGLFAMVDHVIEAGHDPRRFAVDLLDRLRDLMILQAVPGAIEAGLVSAPTDRASVLTAQAQRFSGPQLTYLASTVNDRISDLTGATSPRLLLEIMCAHLLIGSTGPAAAAPAAAPAPAPAANAAAASPAPAGPATPGGAPAANSAVAGAQDPQSAAAAIIARRRAKSQEQQASTPSSAPTSAPAAQPQPQVPSQPESQPDAQPKAQPEQPAAAEAHSTQKPQNQEPQPKPQQQEAGDPWQRERKIPQAEVPEQQSAQSAQSEAPHSAPTQEKHREPLEKPVPARAEESAQETKPESGAESGAEKASEMAQPQAAEEPAGDFAEAVREKWVALRGSVGKRNKVAEIMLAEARVLGFRDGTLTLGHTTGALAERINAPANNAVIVEVLKEEFQRDVAVTCVVGTDPKTAGFDAPRPPQRKEAWKPNPPAREPADDQEAESKPESAPGWRSRIARATQAAKQRDESQFSNGVPLPPEPEPDFGAPPEEPPAYTRDDEERDMMEAAQSTGEMDHRSATEVAMELLERELGARRA